MDGREPAAAVARTHPKVSVGIDFQFNEALITKRARHFERFVTSTGTSTRISTLVSLMNLLLECCDSLDVPRLLPTITT